jgi:hypothetical protein
MTPSVDGDGHITGAVVDIWENQSDGTPCEPHADTIAHELGHVFGLQNANSIDCTGHIMGPRVNFGGSLGTRSVSQEPCRAAKNQWLTSRERDDELAICREWCGVNCTWDCHNAEEPPNCGGSPVIVDVDRNGFHLVGREHGVTFDLNADGIPDRVSWTSAGSDDAFLALDRNGNGDIDDSTELFGNYTRMFDGSRATHGFNALAELDRDIRGGNGDGYLTAEDQMWPRLVLWTDKNHNGVSEPNEVRRLDHAGVIAVSLAYRLSRRVDGSGNRFRYQGVIFRAVRGATVPATLYDVFLMYQ